MINIKYLSSMLASLAIAKRLPSGLATATTLGLATAPALLIAFSITPATTASTDNSNKTIYCQSGSEIPTTVARRADGEELTIFHWKDETLPENLNPQQLCTEVSQKLQDYATEGYQLSSFKTHDLDGIPLICAEENTGYCSLVLFTLNASNNQADSNLLLGEILDDNLKQEEIIFLERGVQFYGYKVNFWNLLGF